MLTNSNNNAAKALKFDGDRIAGGIDLIGVGGRTGFIGFKRTTGEGEREGPLHAICCAR